MVTAAAASAVVGGSAKRLLLLTTRTAAMPAVRASSWCALSARHLHSSVRRLSVLSSAAQTLQQPNSMCVRIAFTLGSSSSNSSRILQRALSTLPTSNNNSSKSSANPQQDEQKRRDDEARTIKKKLAADIEKARNLALHQVVNVPNVITFARILSTPYLAYLIVDGQYEPAIALLAVAGLSDWLDGYIARTYKQESIIGSFLDPFADKLMIGALSLSMMGSGLLPWPLVTLIFGRDVLLVSGTFYHRLKTKDADTAFFDTSDSGAFEVKPTLLSKVNTALQLALFGLTLTNAAWHVPVDPALHALFGVVGATTFASGSEYLWSYINQTGAFRPLHKSAAALKTKATKSKSAPKE